MRKHESELRDYVMNNLDNDGLFSKTYSQISKELNDISMQNIRLIMIDLVKEGFLIPEIKPSRGRNSNPTYKIKSNGLSSVLNIAETTNPKVLEIEFGGIILHILQTEIGGCISKEELAVSTIESTDLIDKIIEANKEQFAPNMIIIDGKVFLNRISVLNFIMKLNISNVLNVKRQVLIDLQNTILDKMCSSILEGKIILTKDDHIKIRNNLSCLTDIQKEDVENLFINLEEQIESLVSGISSTVAKQSFEISKLNKEVKQLNGRIIIERNAKDNLITRNNELNSKLLER